MAAKAFVLIETSVGNTSRVAGLLKGYPGVEAVDVVTGPYDIIATIAGNDMSSIADLVTGEVHGIGGVVRTTTCVAVGT